VAGKDQGIWEIRGDPRDFLYSKLMCWVALDRAITLAGRLAARDRVHGWATARGEIRAAILERGWNARAGAFAQAFGSEDLDASALMLAIAGFLPGDDPRMKATMPSSLPVMVLCPFVVMNFSCRDGASPAAAASRPGRPWRLFAQAPHVLGRAIRRQPGEGPSRGAPAGMSRRTRTTGHACLPGQPPAGEPRAPPRLCQVGPGRGNPPPDPGD
jgi:Glycosyl hydrolases family 15